MEKCVPVSHDRSGVACAHTTGDLSSAVAILCSVCDIDAGAWGPAGGCFCVQFPQLGVRGEHCRTLTTLALLPSAGAGEGAGAS